MVNAAFAELGYALHRAKLAVAGHSGRRVVFMNIPKTAGSSVNRYFKRCLGTARSGHTVFFYDKMPERDLEAAIARAERARFIGGHFGARILRRIRRDGDFVFTVLRDPAERLRSHYLYDRHHPDGTDAARRLSLAEYVASDDPAAREATDNVMARQLAVGYDLAASADLARDEIAEMALATLASMDYVGFLATLDDDLAHLAVQFGLPPPRRAPRVNVTANLPAAGTTKAGDLAALRALAGPLLDADQLIYRHALAARAAAS